MPYFAFKFVVVLKAEPLKLENYVEMLHTHVEGTYYLWQLTCMEIKVPDLCHIWL